MIRRFLFSLVAVATFTACHPVIKLGYDQGGKYDKKHGGDASKLDKKHSFSSSTEEILASLKDASKEPLFRLEAADAFYTMGDFANAISQADIALDNAGALPKANGYRARWQARMYQLQIVSLLRLGKADEAVGKANECLAYPELLTCHIPAAAATLQKGDGAAFVGHLQAVWKTSPTANLDQLVVRGAATLKDQRAPLLDLYRTAYQPGWAQRDDQKWKQLILAQMALLSGDTEAARSAYGQVGADSITGALTTLNPRARSDRPEYVVAAVLWGTPADAAGIRPCDRLVGVNGMATRHAKLYLAEWDRIARKARPGDEVSIEVKHSDGKLETVKLQWGNHWGASRLQKQAPSSADLAVCSANEIEPNIYSSVFAINSAF